MPIAVFSYEKKETAGKEDADRIMLKLMKTAPLKADPPKEPEWKGK